MDQKFSDHSLHHSEEILQWVEEFYEELLESIKDLRLPLSPPIPKTVMSLSDNVNELLELEEKRKEELTLYQYYRLCKLLGRLNLISIDYSMYSKTQKRLYKYYSRANYYLRLALGYSDIEETEKLKLQVQTGILCMRFAWTFQGSTSDPVERLANNVNWSRYITENELYELINDAKTLLEEALREGKVDLSENTLERAWEYLGLAQSLLAKSPEEHLISAEAYLNANKYYLTRHLTTESFRVAMHACLEFSKAGEWNKTVECFEAFFNYGDPLDGPSKISIKNILEPYCLVASELAISLTGT